MSCRYGIAHFYDLVPVQVQRIALFERGLCLNDLVCLLSGGTGVGATAAWRPAGTETPGWPVDLNNVASWLQHVQTIFNWLQSQSLPIPQWRTELWKRWTKDEDEDTYPTNPTRHLPTNINLLGWAQSCSKRSYINYCSVWMCKKQFLIVAVFWLTCRPAWKWLKKE